MMVILWFLVSTISSLLIRMPFIYSWLTLGIAAPTNNKSFIALEPNIYNLLLVP